MPSRLAKRVMGGVGAALAIVGGVNIVLTVYLRLRDGRAAEGWIDIYGQPQSWGAVAGALIAFALVFPFAALAVLVHLWKRSREEGISMQQAIREFRKQR